MNSPLSPSPPSSSGPKTPGDEPDGYPIDSSKGPGPTAPTATGYPVGSMLTDSTLPDLYTEAYNLALQAVTEDAAGDPHTARILYCEACELLGQISKLLPHGDELQGVERKSHQYSTRAESLWNARDASETVHEVKEISKLERLIQEAQFAYEQGVAEYEKQHEQGALDFFTDSADLYWQAWKEAPEGSQKNALKETLSRVMAMAEDIKGIPANTQPLLKAKAGATIISGPSNLTPQELAVLKKTMVINNKVYHPWSDADVRDLLREKGPFVDPDGMLPLSEKQLAKFGAWKRASQIMENPKMICLLSSTSIVQDLVTDCSFVASLCVSASYERRWKKQLIRACIYPKNKFGEPCYNPNGKYLVKLTFNGIPRRVVVDDYLPVSKTGTLMCTFSTNKNELWPSIIEKAYMKLMGGYDFPGSNSGIDLYALTGWIPEHIFIKEAGFDKEKQWKRMVNGMRNGMALVTIATGHLSDEDADRLGLVPTHAYAVLDLKEIRGLRLLQVKNPWSHKRWKGPYSHLDAKHWTSELKAELNFDQLSALKTDDGIFWIDYDSVCTNFDTIHINWNLETLNYRAVLHAPWPCNYGPKRDNYNLGYNPQFSLTTNVKGTRSAGIWLLLSKHITMTEENRDFITLHVFEGQKQQQTSASSTPIGEPSSSQKQLGFFHQSGSPLSTENAIEIVGQRVYYESNSLVKGMYVNSPHILVRFEVPPGKHNYTIVLSQHVKLRDLHFTLRAYAMCEFSMKEIPKKYPLETVYEGTWTDETAGGCSYNAGFYNNPQYQLSVPILPAPQMTTSVLLMLESPKDYAAHIQIVNSDGKRVSSVWTKDIVAQSGEYRHGFCYCEISELRPGVYTVIVSTFEPGQTGRYKLTVQSMIDLPLTPIPIEGAGMFKNVLKGQWVIGESAMGHNHYTSPMYAKNPQFLVPVQEMTALKVRLQTPEMTPTPKIKVTIFKRLDEGVLGDEVCSSGPYSAVPQGAATDTKTLLPSQYGYSIVVSTYEPGLAGKFVLYCYSDRALKIEPSGRASSSVTVSTNSTSGNNGHRRSGSGSGGTPSPLTPSRFRRHFGSAGNTYSPVS